LSDDERLNYPYSNSLRSNTTATRTRTRTTTIRDNCFQTVTGIQVPAMSRPPEQQSSETEWHESRSWWIGLVVLVVIISMACCCAITIWRKCRRDKRLNNVAVADYDNGNLVILASPSLPCSFASFGISEEDRKATTKCWNEIIEEQIDESSAV